MTKHQLITSVMEDGFMDSFLGKSMKPWLNREEFYQELSLATCQAAECWDETKGCWRTWVYWWWRSAKTRVYRRSFTNSRLTFQGGREFSQVVDPSKPQSEEMQSLMAALAGVGDRVAFAALSQHREIVQEFGCSRVDARRLKRQAILKVKRSMESNATGN